MGIDVYLEWTGKTESDKDAQMTGFKVDQGHVGYLREAYHGAPYATRVLVPEGFNEDTYPDGAEIPAAILRERLPATVLVALYRDHMVYGEGPKGEIQIEDGGLATLPKLLADVFAGMATGKRDTEAVARGIAPEQITQAEALIAKRELPDYALAYVDFVELAEQKERETGKPCRIVVSA